MLMDHSMSGLTESVKQVCKSEFATVIDSLIRRSANANIVHQYSSSTNDGSQKDYECAEVYSLELGAWLTHENTTFPT